MEQPKGSVSLNRRHSDELVHGFDLHGCLVFDDFTAISCPPRKGVLSSVSFLTSPEEVGDVVGTTLSSSTIAFPRWTTVSNSCSSKHLPDKSIFVVPIIIPPFVICDTAVKVNVEARRSESAILGPSKVKRPAAQLSEKRKSWMRKLSPTRHAEGEDSVLFDDMVDDIDHEEYDETEAELGHFEEFLTSLADPDEHLSKQPEMKRWLEDIMGFLRLMENAGCLAVVLIGLLPNADKSVVTQVDIAVSFPKKFRTDLTMPAVFLQQEYQQFDSFMALQIGSSISRAALTPIPLKAGDHIYREIKPKGALSLITHHGIYVGHGRVIHFSGNESSSKRLLFNQKRAKICSVSILTFVKQGSRLKVRRYSESDAPDKVIHRAEEALSQQTYDDYNLFSNNCEHFAHYCKRGGRRSRQVERGVSYAVAAGVTAVAVAVALALKKK